MIKNNLFSVVKVKINGTLAGALGDHPQLVAVFSCPSSFVPFVLLLCVSATERPSNQQLQLAQKMPQQHPSEDCVLTLAIKIKNEKYYVNVSALIFFLVYRFGSLVSDYILTFDQNVLINFEPSLSLTSLPVACSYT